LGRSSALPRICPPSASLSEACSTSFGSESSRRERSRKRNVADRSPMQHNHTQALTCALSPQCQDSPPVELSLFSLCTALSHHQQIWSLPIACRALSLPSLLRLCAWILLEPRMVRKRGAEKRGVETQIATDATSCSVISQAISCSCVGVLSAVCIACVSLIEPLRWTSTFVPLLPQEMLCVLESPVAFIGESALLRLICGCFLKRSL
jgi:hypothetical protein